MYYIYCICFARDGVYDVLSSQASILYTLYIIYMHYMLSVMYYYIYFACDGVYVVVPSDEI